MEQPTTLLEAIVYFSDADRAFEFAKMLRWPDGQPACPRCGSLGDHSFLKTRRIWKCQDCKKQFSLKVGSVFEDSPIGLDKWLPCVWLIANSKNSISSHEVGRALGVTQKTAWFMLHRVREAFLGNATGKLSGTIEIDETFIGGLAKNMHTNRRQHIKGPKSGKVAVQGMLSRGGDVRAQVVISPSQYQTQVAIRNAVAYGSTIYTDESQLYGRVGESYAHKTVNHSFEYVSGDVWTNGIENFWALLKRSLKGTQVHVDQKHLNRYVTERVFSFNYCKATDLERMRYATRGIAGHRLTWAQLTAK